MTLTRLALRDFTAFHRAEFEFGPGLNVLTGPPGTGKSHVLRVVNGLCVGAVQGALGRHETPVERARTLDWTWSTMVMFGLLANPCFRETLDLVRRGVRSGLSHGAFRFRSGTDGEFQVHVQRGMAFRFAHVARRGEPEPVFIPPGNAFLEVPKLAHRPNLDDPEFDHGRVLVAQQLERGRRATTSLASRHALRQSPRAVLGGRVVKRGNAFFLRSATGETEAEKLPEGMRALATIEYLISNGNLEPGGVLVWDEPAAELDAAQLPAIASVCRDLARRGLQVITATRSRALAREISRLDAGGNSRRGTRFFRLQRGAADSATRVVAGPLVDLRVARVGEGEGRPAARAPARAHEEELA